MAKIIQLNSRGDEAEYVRLRTLLDSMTFDIEKGENVKDFLHALRNVIIAMAKRSPFTRKALEVSILPKVLRMICLQYGPTKASVSNHSEGDSSVARFNEAMKSRSIAISDPPL